MHAANTALNMEKIMNVSETKAIDSEGLWEELSQSVSKGQESVSNIDAETNTHLETEPKQNITTAKTREAAMPASEGAPSTAVAMTAVSTNNVSTSSQPIGIANLDNVTPLAQDSFPNQPRKASKQIPGTLANIIYMLVSYGITIRYNVISKKVHITIPGVKGTLDNADNVAIAHLISLANLNDMATGQFMSFICVIGDKHQFNPVADWIMSKKWDGVDRLNSFYATLIHRADFPEKLKHALMYRWLLSAVAAALKPSAFKARGVLTLQGSQSIGKTSWISALIPDAILRESVLKLDHHLDAGTKDSIITAVCHWIVEIGELDSSFKKDIARLKGFLTADRDKVRRPYGRTDSEYPRRTVFCATVNEDNFLVDSTGNSRWWTIPVTAINYEHCIDMQQVFAQLTINFTSGDQWWLTREEETLLELQNKDHRAISVIRERLLDAFDLSRISDKNLSAMSTTQVLKAIGMDRPTNNNCKECASILREYFGEAKKIQGVYKWRIPFRKEHWNADLTAKLDDSGRY